MALRKRNVQAQAWVGIMFKVVTVALLMLLAPLDRVLRADWATMLLFQKNGLQSGNAFGLSVASAGDVNGDGKIDFIIGAPSYLSGHGSAFVHSGADGSLLYRKDGAAYYDNLGFSVASAGDVNGDGKADFIVGAPLVYPAGFAYLYSGADGSLLFQEYGSRRCADMGGSVASAGDVNGDGKADFIIGSDGLGCGSFDNLLPGSAYVISGANGSVLHIKTGAGTWFRLGRSVSSAGDLNGDGKSDFMVGAVWANPDGLYHAGSVYIYSGADGSLLYQKNGTADNDEMGASAASAGDLNGDGKPDFIIGANNASPGGLNAAGLAYIYSGTDGSLLYQKNGAAPGDNLGFSVASAGDMNGDGKADFIIGAPFASPEGRRATGSVYAYSGADGSLLFQKNGADSLDRLGYSVASAGDLDGDGRYEVILGAPYADPGGLIDAGTAYIYSLCGSARGDMNGDKQLTPADIVSLLLCVFIQAGNCNICYSDLNCDRTVNLVDIGIALNGVFFGSPMTCTP